MTLRLYKCRSGLVVNLNAIAFISLRVNSTPEAYAQMALIDTDINNRIVINKSSYDEIVEKCERYAN